MEGYITLWTDRGTVDARGGLQTLVRLAKAAISRGETPTMGRVERYNLSSSYRITGQELVQRATRKR